MKTTMLFICMANQQRSPTFENWIRTNRPQYDVKSCGVSLSADVRINKELLEWADKIFVMDLEQEMYIYRNFNELLNKVILVGCSDEYQREGLDLHRLIEYWVKKIGI